jgi:UDP-arabinose 4-epimerase
MRTVFVTGGAGYVGSHSCKAFAEGGWRVVVYDNLSRGYRDLARWGELIEGDLNDLPTLSAALAKTKPEVVAHFAAFASVPESMRDPDTYYRINVEGTRSLLHAMGREGVGQLVFSSSCATFGVHKELITEDTRQSPINPYGATKLAGERMVQDFGAANGPRSVILRYFNAAGADAALETGERNTHDPRVIPLAIRGAMDGAFTFTIYGDQLDTPDGSCVRDFVHVTDLADAHLRALDWLSAGKESQAFNLGTGVGLSVKQLADAVERVCAANITRAIAPARAGDPPSLVASAAKAERLLGWTPQHSSIDNIISTAWAWAKKDRAR